jgi:adenine deaminase
LNGFFERRNSLSHFGDYGNLAPGRVAFINLVDNLKDFNIISVIYDNQEVAGMESTFAPLKKPIYPNDF